MNEHDQHTTGAIAAALAKVQAELPDLARDRTVEVQQKNGGKYSYSYVTLANLSKAVLPLLAKNGLAYTAAPGTSADGKMVLRYHLLHTSGEQLSGEFPISSEGGIQMVGGRITYARRYCLAALVGVAADEDDESRLQDSGGTAQRATPQRRTQATAPSGRQAQRTQKRAEPPPLPTETDGITKPQLGKLHALFSDYGITDRDAGLAYCSDATGRQIASTKDLTKAEAHKIIDRLDQELADNFADSEQPAADDDARAEAT